jgi:hypothetical protein
MWCFQIILWKIQSFESWKFQFDSWFKGCEHNKEQSMNLSLVITKSDASSKLSMNPNKNVFNCLNISKSLLLKWFFKHFITRKMMKIYYNLNKKIFVENRFFDHFECNSLYIEREITTSQRRKLLFIPWFKNILKNSNSFQKISIDPKSLLIRSKLSFLHFIYG